MREKTAFFRRSPVQHAVAICALACAAQIALSLPLWAFGSNFPKVPVWGAAKLMLIDVAGSWGALAMLGCAVGLIARPADRVPAWLWIGVLTLYVLRDLNCLQPWVWFYALLLLGAGVRQGSDETAALNTLRWIVVAVYVWSGFNKITPYFAEDNWAWLTGAFSWTKPLGQIPALGYAAAVGEALLGLALAWPPGRRYARWAAVLFHGCLILVLSPWSLNWNTVVIPWNAALAALVWVLFADDQPLMLPRHTAAIVLTALASIMPAFNLLERWPDNLSWKLYANTQCEGTFAAQGAMDSSALEYVWQTYGEPNEGKIFFDDWATRSLGVPPYPSPDAYRRIGRFLCTELRTDEQSGLYLLRVDRWNRARERFEFQTCDDLQKQP